MAARAKGWRGRAGEALRTLALVLTLAAIVVGVVHRSWIVAQVRVVVVLSTAESTPVLSWVVGLLTKKPHVEETVIAEAPTTLVRPGGSGPWRALVFVNGATARGRHHPDVQRLARGLGRAGYLVFVPDLPGLREGEITDRTVAAAIAVAVSAAARRDVRGGRVGFFGVSVGTTVALLAAEDPQLGDRVSVVAGLAPYTDLANVIRLATTATYPANGHVIAYRTPPFLTLVVARSVVAGLPEKRDRQLLAARLAGADEHTDDPLAPLRTLETQLLSPAGRAVVRLLLNSDPKGFEQLYAALPASMREGVRRLSPLAAAERLRAPIEIATAPRDKYFPVAESEALAQRAPHTRVTVTSTLAHAIPKLAFDDLADVLRFDAFAVRVLHAAGV
jgi:dienelactone hydrolase